MASAAVFLPLLAALFAALAGPVLPVRGSGIASTVLVALAALASLMVLTGESAESVRLGTWISVGGFDVDWAIRTDSLSVLMMVVVNSISALIHLYAVGYMARDAHQPRFFAYLSLFTFSMLALVSADNFLQLFFGWEGVGLCSYLLIGFWFHRPSANAAAIKAFLVNRIGDVGLVIGLAALLAVFGSFSFDDIFADVDRVGSETLLGFPALEVIAFLLFAGAMGKSAQIGLHTWLPDAMEGPTPVSALIHAATMVTAGVFLVARCAPLYEAAPFALGAVVVVGAATALFAGTVALVQTDIKRVIAWSTCSQLGYMFLACGVTAHASALFHLFTHACFKALLFLGAGAVIHALDDEQDMRRMGGLARALPVTCAGMAVGSLALSGIPPFAGFWSKDAILEAAFAQGSPVALIGFWAGLAAALLTGIYVWRLVFLVFAGAPRADAAKMEHVHESPWSMRVPVVVLAVAACVVGWLAHDLASPQASFWNGAFAFVHTSPHHPPLWVRILPAFAGVAGLVIAWFLYARGTAFITKIARFVPGVHAFFARSWYFDELFTALFVRPVRGLGSWLSRTVDQGLIDRLGPEGTAAATIEGARRMRLFQSGYIDHYALVMVLGAVAFVAWNLVVGGGR